MGSGRCSTPGTAEHAANVLEGRTPREGEPIELLAEEWFVEAVLLCPAGQVASSGSAACYACPPGPQAREGGQYCPGTINLRFYEVRKNIHFHKDPYRTTCSLRCIHKIHVFL